MKGRFSALLVSLVLLFLIGPLLPGDQTFVDRVFGIMTLAVLISCLRAIARTRGFFWFMLIFSCINLAIGSFELVSSTETVPFRVIAQMVRLAYCAAVFLSIMRYVLDDSPVTSDKICGAISAYLLIGIIWSFVYGLFFQFDPGSFNIPEVWKTPGINSPWAIYFSFTTLTTLGYGDITPQSPGVQSYAIIEAASGQIFLAVIIARLVALQITHKRDQ